MVRKMLPLWWLFSSPRDGSSYFGSVVPIIDIPANHFVCAIVHLYFPFVHISIILLLPVKILTRIWPYILPGFQCFSKHSNQSSVSSYTCLLLCTVSFRSLLFCLICFYFVLFLGFNFEGLLFLFWGGLNHREVPYIGAKFDPVELCGFG